MNLDLFVRERGTLWSELEQLVRDAGRRPERLGAARVRRLGTLYRSAAADLAFARGSFPGEPLVERLEGLVARARALVYAAPARRGSVLSFLASGYWRLVAQRRVALLVSAALLFGPWILSATWAVSDPSGAGSLVPAEYASVTEPRPAGRDLGLSPAEEAAFSSQIFTNNIRVSILAFAAGILAGIGTAAVLIFNGTLLGLITGLAIGAGNGRSFFELVTAHGVLELSCIVVAGAAGLRFGWALVEPGRRTRADSLQREARPALALVAGTAPWLVVAGLVEGFVTPAGTGLTTVLLVGFGLGAIYWGLVLWRGRAVTDEREPSPADTP
jgi:uncharacterized membrane protein SpoIIM required for sporulation